MDWTKINSIHRREEPNDLFFTPAALVVDLLKKVPFENDDSILDPFAGAGVWFDNFPTGHPTAWAELERGVDFWSIDERFDWLVTNPPFSDLTKIFNRSCHLAKKGFAYLLPLNCLSYVRLEKMASLGFNIVDLTIFRNPPAWKIGFQMCFVVWKKHSSIDSISFVRDNVHQLQLTDY